ncbi:MAG: hypothetical protein DRJ40_07020 [Thermoprotei archaeon]|nr:MAG: hypothetical protein DRJ40_07020 [Thermoprotei archaeon]
MYSEELKQLIEKLRSTPRQDRAIREFIKELGKIVQDKFRCKAISIDLGEKQPLMLYLETKERSTYNNVSNFINDILSKVSSEIGLSVSRKDMREDTHFFIQNHWICVKLVE